MKSRETLIRLRRFEVDEKRQKVVEIESMIDDFKQMAADLDRQIKSEEERAGVSDIKHYAYPTYAKAALARRDNLTASAQNLVAKLEAARDELAEAFEELKKVELLEERDGDRMKARRDSVEQAEYDDIGRMGMMRLAGEHG
ncbi:MAG: flagellar export protein FliJ [Hyphomicrobiales bacterium]